MQARDIELILAQTVLARSSERGNPEEANNNTYGQSPDQKTFRSIALSYLSELFKLPEMESVARESELRLRVALHLSCPEAINYDFQRTEPRWALIKAHLDKHFDFNPDETEKISRLVATVLDDWDVGRRRGLEARRGKLLERQNYRCMSCHLNFSDSLRIEAEEIRALSGQSDRFKPYYDGNGVQDAMAPEVDHINVVSKDGTNQSDNLQILCALCNQGKGDNSGVRPSRELKYSHLPLHEIPRGHLMSLLYYRLRLDGSRCTVCNSRQNELTVRLTRTSGPVTLTNLHSICYECADNLSPI
jgi:hypothetical protein